MELKLLSVFFEWVLQLWNKFKVLNFDGKAEQAYKQLDGKTIFELVLKYWSENKLPLTKKTY